MRRKPKVSTKILKCILAAVLAVAALAAVFLISARRFVLVMDAATYLAMPKAELARTRISLAGRWSHLVVVQPQADVLDDPLLLEDFVQGIGSRYRVGAVLFSRVVSSRIAEYAIDASSLVPEAAVYGIEMAAEAEEVGREGEASLGGLFDTTLVANVQSGWEDAAASLHDDVSSMSRNVAVVSDSYGSIYNQAISSNLPAGMLSVYTNEDGSRLFVASTVREMNRLGIVIAMCPHLDDFYAAFDADDTISWIVDYRYSSIVPERQLYGTVLPDLSGFAAAAPLSKQDAVEIGRSGGMELEFKYDGR